MRGSIALLAALTIAAPAQAQRFAILPGSEATLASVDGDFAPVASAAAEPDAFETWAANAFARGAMPDATGPNAAAVPKGPPAPTPPANRLMFRLLVLPGEKPSTLLIVRNGFDRALVYRAEMRVKGKQSPTDVCLVMPGKTGIEHWPYAIDQLVLDDLKLVPWKPGDPVRCA